MLESYEGFVSSTTYLENAPSFVELTSLLLDDKVCRELRSNRHQQGEVLAAKGEISYQRGGSASTDVKSDNAGRKLLNKNVCCHWCGSPEHLLRASPKFKEEIIKCTTERNKNIKALAVTKDSDSDDSDKQFFDDDFAANLDSSEKVAVHLVNLD